ncbi:MAG: hypothetical protein V4564_15130 [Pseudomonadota bacterium]
MPINNQIIGITVNWNYEVADPFQRWGSLDQRITVAFRRFQNSYVLNLEKISLSIKAPRPSQANSKAAYSM